MLGKKKRVCGVLLEKIKMLSYPPKKPLRKDPVSGIGLLFTIPPVVGLPGEPA
jgi:hypothetical protein